MECNKEEAIRAKSIAESKMQSKDFAGALKIALKAQRLFPDMESISQMLTICEVHCAASAKISGEKDWYAVLQLEKTADDSTIRKQYRKLALLLHPDKNKLPGAGGAFQLVGDAYKTLSDPVKRAQHDMFKGANFNRVFLNRATQNSYKPSAKKQPGPGVSSTAAKTSFAHFSGLNHSQPSHVSNSQALWTMCPSCSVSIQYYENVLDKEVRCHKCFKIFVASDLKSQCAPSSGNVTHQRSDKAPTVGPQEAKSGDSVFKPLSKPEPCSTSERDVVHDVDGDLNRCNGMKYEKVQLQPSHGEQETSPSDWNTMQNSANNVDRTAGLNVGKAPNPLRRSKRKRQNVSYCEVEGKVTNMASVPVASKKTRQGDKLAPKMQKSEAFSEAVAGTKREESKDSCKSSKLDDNITSGKTSAFPDNLTYPAPQFCDFESERREDKFAVDQIWALYDGIDGMPRFYARVKRVNTREFKLQLNWLENDPRTISEMKWSEHGLPIACGSFKLGKPYNTLDRFVFSHLMLWKKGMKRNSFVIYPRKGEVWALFKNWDVNWSSDPDKHRVYEYQIVEVVSDFSDGAGISVVRLSKIKEFMALFIRDTDAEESFLEIPAKDALMFSHRIPAYRMTGKEEDGVPEGSLELDCASLPSNFTSTMPSVSISSITTKAQKSVDSTTENGFEPKKQNAQGERTPEMRPASQGVNCTSEKSPNVLLQNKIGTESTMPSNTDSQNPNPKRQGASPGFLAYEYPESEFYDFEKDRSLEKFECGQIWALYCEIDNYPKYYGRLRKVDKDNRKVQVRWLEAFSTPNKSDDFAEGKPPPACGAFRATNETCTMELDGTFSHQVKAKPMSSQGHYHIFPDVGDVWAVFKNWSSSLTVADLKACEFDFVEISDHDSSSGIKALVLTKVDGHISVFRRKAEGHLSIKLIPFNECLSFSHRVPAYQLTKEMGRDYWELDPAALPTYFWSSIL